MRSRTAKCVEGRLILIRPKFGAHLNPALRIVNFIALAFYGFAVIAIALANPSASVPAAFNLLPFGLALLAARADASRTAVWAGILVNVLWVLLYVGIAMTVLAGLGGSLVAVPLVLLVAIPSVGSMSLRFAAHSMRAPNPSIEGTSDSKLRLPLAALMSNIRCQ